MKLIIKLIFIFLIPTSISFAKYEVQTNGPMLNQAVEDTQVIHSFEKEKDFIFAPIMNSGPTTGTMLGITGMYFFQADDKEGTQKSVIQPIAMYSDTESYFYGLFGSLFLNGDKQRLTLFVGESHIENEFENIFSNLGSVDFSTNLDVAYGKFQQLIFNNTYFGLEVLDANVVHIPDNDLGDSYLSLSNSNFKKTDIFGYGPSLTYDRTDNSTSPRNGIMAEFKILFFPGDFNEKEYFVTETFFNYYEDVRQKKDVIAFRGYGRFTEDSLYKSTIGRGVDLRAYKFGEYVADNLITIQGEYRLKVSDLVGLVGFAGIGALYNNGETITSDEIYPSLGVGVRYNLIPEKNINFRIDYAKGKDNNETIYISINEAF